MLYAQKENSQLRLFNMGSRRREVNKCHTDTKVCLSNNTEIEIKKTATDSCGSSLSVMEKAKLYHMAEYNEMTRIVCNINLH